MKTLHVTVLLAAAWALALPALVSAQSDPYKAGAPAMQAMVSGEVDFPFAEALLAAPQIKAGKVRALFEQDALIAAGARRKISAPTSSARSTDMPT